MRRQHVRVARRRRAGQIEAGANFGLDLANMQELTTLITLRGMREITRPTLFTELKRRQALSYGFDAELEKALLA